VPPKLLSRARLSTTRVLPLRACVLIYTLSWKELAVLTCALTSNVLVHTPDAWELETLPRSAYCRPSTHDEHSLAVASVPVSIVKFVSLLKCGSKNTSVSAGALALAKRFTSADNVSTLLLHSDCQRVTSSLLFAFACQK
jgi:hypothetical protein